MKEVRLEGLVFLVEIARRWEGATRRGVARAILELKVSGLKGERKGSDRMGTAQVNGTDKPVVRTGPEKVMGDDER